MVEKICSHCGTTVLVGLQYCPGCLRALSNQDDRTEPPAALTIAPDAKGTRLERLQSKWEDVATWISTSSAPAPSEKDDPRFAYKMANGSMTMAISESYTRIVCPKCLRPQRASIDLPPSAMVMCDVCLHQFPASFAAEFRKGADLECYQCGITTFCVNGLKITHCPNCKTSAKKVRDPEKAKVIAFAAAVAFLLIAGFTHAVATQTTSQYLLWVCVASVFTFFGFLTLVALGF